MTPRREVLGAAVLAILGVGLRLAFCAAFPSDPVSDFRGLVLFGVRLRDEGLAVPGWHWIQFNSGLPLIFSALFRVFPYGVGAVARVATATATGLAGLLPFLIWRRILAFRWRFLAGLLLALWPGQVFFSGVAAQENWALLPTVALACLAVARLRDPADTGHPIAAGLLLCAAAAIRREMLGVMLAPSLAAAGVPGARRGRGARLSRFAVAAAIPLLLLAAERRAATARFAITTEHGRLMVPAIALELLVVALASADLAAPGARRQRFAFLLSAALASAILFGALPPLERLAIRKDEKPPVVSRFPLAIAGGGGFAECTVDSGRLTALAGDRAWVAPSAADTLARVGCRLPLGRDCAALAVDVQDREGLIAPAEADGEERFVRIPLPGGGWLRAPLCDAASRPPGSCPGDPGCPGGGGTRFWVRAREPGRARFAAVPRSSVDGAVPRAAGYLSERAAETTAAHRAAGRRDSSTSGSGVSARGAARRLRGCAPGSAVGRLEG